MTIDKVRYPSPGCVVEFMQGNSPHLAVVLEEQGGRLRLYTQGKREMNLTAARLLPWFGPLRGSGLSRHAMDVAMEEAHTLRDSLAKDIAVHDVWELVQGEVHKAGAEWLASLVWAQPTVDHEAALGRSLINCKTHFRFSPPDFEIFPETVVQQRLAEAEAIRVRDVIAGAGAQFFRLLWDIQSGKRGPLTPQEQPAPELAERLRTMLFERMADPDATEDDSLWRLLVKGLPEHPFLPLLLATAWGLVPEHYNFHLDRAGFAPGETWAEPFAGAMDSLRTRYAEALRALPPFTLGEDGGLVTIDPASAQDRDDAFFVSCRGESGFRVVVALACPAVIWDFDDPFDKTVLRRHSSIYLPEGNQHMLPAAVGWQLFSMDEGRQRPSLVLDITLDAQGMPLASDIRLVSVSVTANLNLEESEAGFTCFASAAARNAGDHTAEPDWGKVFTGTEALPLSAPSPADLPEDHPVRPHAALFAAAHKLAVLLQRKRIRHGAVITERPDPEVILTEKDGQVRVEIHTPPPTPASHLVIGEMMILANSLLAEWAIAHAVPLFFRSQDVGLPKDFAGVWTAPHDISRVVRGLPGASLEAQPRRHAGLGLQAYTSCTSPIRRYTDLLNQGQVVSFLRTGAPRLSQGELASLLPLMSARNDAIMQVQRSRPRYWKLVFLRQQGPKVWWDAVITEESNSFIGISLPWAQLLLRGRRNLFSEKITLGQDIQVRIGKVNPLLNEMSIVETREPE